MVTRCCCVFLAVCLPLVVGDGYEGGDSGYFSLKINSVSALSVVR